jgi:hypothetical protein
MYPVLMYAIWQIHFAQVLRHWHRKGANVQLAIAVDRAAREINWNEMADLASVSQQRQLVNQALSIIDQIASDQVNSEMDHRLEEQIHSVASKQP